MDFIGEMIKVETAGEIKRPVRFTWRGREYVIRAILASWQDFSMPPTLQRPKWIMRHHRNYYHVETEDGRRFEIYLDRGARRPEWVLLKDLGGLPSGDVEESD